MNWRAESSIHSSRRAARRGTRRSSNRESSMSDTKDLGDVASNVTPDTEDLAKVVTAGSEAAGVGFGVAGVEKFKLHKDNPTQLPVEKKI
jgi:hypothetical protein